MRVARAPMQSGKVWTGPDPRARLVGPGAHPQKIVVQIAGPRSRITVDIPIECVKRKSSQSPNVPIELFDVILRAADAVFHVLS